MMVLGTSASKAKLGGTSRVICCVLALSIRCDAIRVFFVKPATAHEVLKYLTLAVLQPLEDGSMPT